MRTERLQTLTDGVFAIAMTLLVLGLPLPKRSHNLAHDLAHQWPFYAAYVVSFVTVAIVWINHHKLMDGVARADRTLVDLNLVLLLCVAAVPWPTALIANYLRSSKQGSAAGVVYGIVLGLVATSFTAIWIWLALREELAHPAARPVIAQAVRRSLVGPAVYLIGAFVALISPTTALLLYAGVAVFFALSGRFSPSREPTP